MRSTTNKNQGFQQLWFFALLWEDKNMLDIIWMQRWHNNRIYEGENTGHIEEVPPLYKTRLQDRSGLADSIDIRNLDRIYLLWYW